MIPIRVGVIGCGGMARAHIKYFPTIPGLAFTAAADSSPENLRLVTDAHPHVQTFDDGHKLIASGAADAVLICTPHYFHAELAIAAFKQGLHVLTEKPVAVTALAAEQVNAEHARRPDLVYAAMFQMREAPLWKRLKHMITTGQIGEIKRVSWIVTNWFRTQAYYDAGSWRATWKGEGGGVLLNQCPHNLDLLCWLLGPPQSVHAHVHLGKHHHIEVEDDVTAYLEWKNGATGTFITSTGDSPGTDRLEITGDRGKAVVEGKRITFQHTYDSVINFCANSDEAFGQPLSDTITIDVKGDDPGHRAVTANFIAAILNSPPSQGGAGGGSSAQSSHTPPTATPLICPGEEGLHELELGNAILMSGLIKQPVQIPMDRPAYDRLLKDLIAKSTFKKPEVRKAKVDMEKSFHKQ
jgi:predicted dehydrogenase